MTDTAAPITIVSGLPRSGTSVMMQMLVAGGMEALTDGVRTPNEDNPRGYYEFERAKAIKTDKAWLADARGKCVKMVHLLLLDLPMEPAAGYRYDVVFVRRDLGEVARSQQIMLARSGKAGGNLSVEQLIAAYTQQIERVLGFLGRHANVRAIEVRYDELVREPETVARRVAEFVQRPMDVGKMAAAVDPSLYRNRSV